MTNTIDHVIDLIFGRWRSQTLYAGVELGVFEIAGEYPKHAIEITEQLDIDRDNGYRILRALGSLGLLEETDDRRFAITPAGELLQADNPVSLRSMALLEEGPTHYALWKHLPDLIREGEQNAFVREFGHDGFVEHREADPEYAEVFNEAMTSYSTMETGWALEMLDGYDFAEVSHVCDVAGGHGHLLSSLLKEHDHLEGTVFELPNVVKEKEQLWAPKLGVEDRCTYVAGDMFEEVPEADVYLMKNVLHDWNDEECVQILSTIRESAPPQAHLFSIDRIIPGPETSHFAKLFDIHMLVATVGRVRTTQEYADLYENAGWQYLDTRYPENELMGALEGVRT